MTFGSRVARAAANHVERDPEPPMRAEACARRRWEGVEQRIQVRLGIGSPMFLRVFQRRPTASFIVNFGTAADEQLRDGGFDSHNSFSMSFAQLRQHRSALMASKSRPFSMASIIGLGS